MICCFGELLLRMSPALDREWINQHNMPVYVGGAELNVATALAQWQVDSRYCTALPDNYLSHEIIDSIKDKDIDPSVHLSGNRIGIYYLPQGADLKNAGVIYDRAGSSFASLRTGMIDWNTVLKGCSWFHFSAISPALNAQATEVCEEAVSIASGLGLTISVDLNYRSKLWKYGKQPVDVMPRLVKYCDVVMGNIWSAAELLGVTVDPGIHEKGTKEAYLAHATKTATGIRSLFPVCKTVANTFRFDDGNGIKYYAALDIDEGQFVSPLLTTREVKDKVGSGDCFMAGLIYGLYKEHQPQDVIDFAAAAAFGKLQETGDATSQTIRAVQNILSKTWTKMKP